MQGHPLPLLQTAVEQSFNAIVVTCATKPEDGGPRITYCNQAFCRMTGYSREELMGQSPRILQGTLTSPSVIQALRESLTSGRFFQGSTINYRKDGSAYVLEWNISPICDDQGVTQAYVSVQRDITERVQAEQLQRLLAQALNATEDAVLIADLHARIIFVNHAFEKQSGYSSDEMLGNTPQRLQSGEHDKAFYAQLRKRLERGESCQITFTNRHKDGHIYYAAQTITPLKDENGQVHHYVSVSKDVSHEVAHTQTLRRQAHHDALTGLLNRHAGEQQLQNCEQQSQLTGEPYALILADIDAFKAINDAFGHEMGDEVLKRCASVLQQTVCRDGFSIRWGGEEFLVILPKTSRAAALATAEQIRHAVAQTQVPGIGQMTLSLGVALSQHSTPCFELLRQADAALYRAKQTGRNRVVLAE